MKTFKIKNHWILCTKIAAWVSAALALFFALGLFLAINKPDVTSLNEPHPPFLTDIGVFLFVTLITTFGAWYCFRYLRDFTSQSVTVDDDGIWLAHLSKETGLILWQDIASIRERNLWQRLELNDCEGMTLIRLEFQLAEFSKLQSIVEKNTKTHIKQATIPATFSRSPAYHLVYAVCFIVFSMLGWWVSGTEPILALVLLAVVIMPTGYSYLKTPIKATVNNDNLIIHYPLISCVYSYSEIKSVQKKNVKVILYGAEQQFTQVEILIRENKKPHELRDFVNGIMLYQLIHTAWKGD